MAHLDSRDYDDYCVSLRVIGALNHGDRLCTTQTGFSIQKNTFLGWWFTRMVSQQSRFTNISMVTSKLTAVFTYIDTLLSFVNQEDHTREMQQLTHLRDLLPGVAQGLTNLSETYSNDENCRAQIQHQVDNVNDMITRIRQSENANENENGNEDSDPEEDY